ncbi:MAG TPA: hypothetical protein VMV81_11955, partial [Phycisphaerae bacterium]|nr:hypothetical protein [Phycisphaerae bacterium]
MGASDSDPRFIRNGINVRILARRQRQIVWLFWAALIAFGLETSLEFLAAGFRLSRMVFIASVGVLWTMKIIVALGTVVLLRVLGMRWIWLPFLAVGMALVSFVSMVVLLLQNNKVMKMLKSAGFDFGYYGTSDEAVVWQLSGTHCVQCGYDLTGNTSGTCPECGRVMRDPA